MTLFANRPVPDLASLTERVLEGDEASLNDFCAAIRPGLVEIASYRMYGRSRHEAEDVVQDTLTIFVEKAREITGSPTSFVLGILYKRVGNALKRLPGNSLTTLDGESAESREAMNAGVPAPFVRDVENRDTIERCAAAIRTMGEPCRTLLVGILEGRSVGEIWERFRASHPEMKRSAFDRRLYLCRRRLLTLMGVEL
jgi:DNA-directed RNA polymerase specialized sigma24 family protein